MMMVLCMSVIRIIIDFKCFDFLKKQISIVQNSYSINSPSCNCLTCIKYTSSISELFHE